MFEELNKVRTDPKSLIPYVKKGISEFNGKIRKGIMTTEGVGAWNELLTVLQSQKPLAPMIWSNSMAKACQIFVSWAGPRGTVGHYGPSGKSMSDRLDAQGEWISTIGKELLYNII